MSMAETGKSAQQKTYRNGQIVIFCHSLLSDWNHGNAHFLRGIVSELKARGEDVVVYEPGGNWSLQNLLAEAQGPSAVENFYHAYPDLDSVFYEPALLRLDRALANAKLVLVHEWSDHAFVRRLGQHRREQSPLSPAVSRHASPLRHRPRQHGRVRPERLRRRSRLRQRDSRPLPRRKAGLAAPGHGTKRQTFGFFTARGKREREKIQGKRIQFNAWLPLVLTLPLTVISSGSATGEMRSGRRNCTSFCLAR